MSKVWIREKMPEFARDLLRDFSMAVDILEAQFVNFDENSKVSFEVFRDLLGVEMNKGLLWRLKDTAHHLFQNDGKQELTGQFLEWSIGYIFHETMKLKEDAYQQQNYGPWFTELLDRELPEREHIISRELFQMLLQTNESIRREVARVRFFIVQCRRLFIEYLRDQGENALLARLLFDHEQLVRKTFGVDHDDLLLSIYGRHPEMLFVMASQSLRQGGWMTHSQQAVDRAVAMVPDNPRVLREKQIVDTWRLKLKA